MKRTLISLFACMMVLLNLAIADVAQAQPLPAISFPGLQSVNLSEEQKTLFKQLETDFLPKIETILNPEQREKLSYAFSEGSASLRKAFKSLTLTPTQKSELGNLFKSLPKRDIFAALTPEQKKQLFVKKKEMYMPTPEEISEKISAGMKTKGKLMPEGVSEKISAKMKSVEKFIPTPKEIGEKVSAGMKMVKDKVEEQVE